MRLTPSLVAASLFLLATPSLYAAPQKDAVVAVSPNPAMPGQTVQLRWYFTGTKVVVSGGRFGKGVVVTGRTSLTDTPRKTTRYTFDVWYQAPAKNAATGMTTVQQLHVTYQVVAEVQAPLPADLSVYRDPRGWQICYLKGWKRDDVPMSDPSYNALMFFQAEEDSVERMAVSILPAKEMTCVDLMSQVQKSLRSNYDEVQVLSDKDVTCADVPAVLSTFTGIDQAHPGTHTQSLVLAFVKNGRAFVVSARTAATQYNAHQ